MAITELILGATRATQLLLSIITTGLASGTIHALLKGDTGAYAPNRYALFVTIANFLSVVFLITSQFLFIRKRNGYAIYITTGVIIEFFNFLLTFAAWIAVVQFSTGPNCTVDFFHRVFQKSCDLDRALLAFLILSWLSWSVSAAIMVNSKINERRDGKTSKEIELRIKAAVETQSKIQTPGGEAASVSSDPEGNVAEGHQVEKM